MLTLLLLAARASPPWPELAATPPMGWNGWLPTTRGLIPGYSNNETMYCERSKVQDERASKGRFTHASSIPSPTVLSTLAAHRHAAG